MTSPFRRLTVPLAVVAAVLVLDAARVSAQDDWGSTCWWNNCQGGLITCLVTSSGPRCSMPAGIVWP